MSSLSFYENADIVAFGESFSRTKPINVLKYFRNRSPFLKEKTMAGYLEHLSQFLDIPEQKNGESDDTFYDRVFDVLVEGNMVSIDMTIH